MTQIPDIQLNPFVLRQTPDSRFTCWTFPEEELILRVAARWDRREEGYRDGVVLVQVLPAGFRSGIVILKDGDKLGGDFSSRQEGEEPRKHIGQVGEGSRFERKQPAVRVDVVLYRADVLAEDPNNEIVGDWDIISVNGSPTNEPAPLRPETLMANHFVISGGTATGWDAKRFEEEMRKSFLYWKDKALID